MNDGLPLEPGTLAWTSRRFFHGHAHKIYIPAGQPCIVIERDRQSPNHLFLVLIDDEVITLWWDQLTTIPPVMS